jgi:cytochrome P450
MAKATIIEFAANPFRPLPTRAPYFDPAREAWVLSRYEDVALALREPALQQASDDTRMVISNEQDSHERLYAEVKADMDRMDSAQWRKRMEETMNAALDRVGAQTDIDLVQDLLHPWSVTLMLELAQPEPAAARDLERVAHSLFFKFPAPLEPSSPEHTSNREPRPVVDGLPESAEAELDRLLKQGHLVLSKSMFLGLTQTLPSFLAHAWLALLLHPGQLARLVAEPSLLPGATEELLRYAGIVQSLFRRSRTRVQLGDITIEEGRFVHLNVAAANHDPARFDRPNDLDLARTPTAHLALGSGSHGCVGAILVRMACTVLLPLIARSGLELDETRPIAWTRDSTLKWPRSVPAKWPPVR